MAAALTPWPTAPCPIARILRSGTCSYMALAMAPARGPTGVLLLTLRMPVSSCAAIGAPSWMQCFYQDRTDSLQYLNDHGIGDGRGSPLHALEWRVHQVEDATEVVL